MSSRFVAFACATGAACWLLSACSSDDPKAAPPAEPTCEGEPGARRFEHGGDGSPDPFGAKAAGQARAGRIRDASQIVQPITARAKVRPGDLVLANDRIAVYIEDAGESDGYSPLGGEILALEPVGDDGRPRGVSQYNETLVMFSRQSVKPERVSVIADGADGKAAIVRSSGVLANVPFLDTFRALLPDEYDFPAAIDYVLEPGASKVLLRLHLQSTRPELVDFVTKQFVGFFQESRSQIFTEATGFAGARGETPWLGFEAFGGEAAFAWRALGTPIRTEIGISGFSLFSLSGLSIDACAEKTVDYAEILVAPGIDPLLEARRADDGEPAWREIRGVLSETGGGALAGAQIHATTTDGRYLTRARTDAAGAFVLHAPPGDVALVPTLKGFAMPAPTVVGAAATTADLALPRRATLNVTITDGATALPARVQVIPQTPLTKVPEAFGVRDEEADGSLWQAFAITGSADLPVPPGTYKVVVTRGYEYEVFEEDVTVAAGDVTPVAAVLTRSFDSPGVMCADFHIHSHYSADSSDEPEYKVRAAIADGLEIPVSSEHEWVIDFQPIVERLGMTQWAFGMASEELTTFTWGHFGVVPLSPRPDAVNAGAVSWVGKTPDRIFREVNELPERPVLIVNHPSGTGFGAYFSQAFYDRAKGAGDAELWSDRFGAIEVFNDSDFEANRETSVADWFSLLDTGRTYWAVGSSDSHSQMTTPVGYPRTCLAFGHDDPTRLSPEIVRDVLRSGAAVISGGLMMTVTAPGGLGPGATAAKGAFTVVVSSPGWLSAETLEVIVDGKTAQTIALTPDATFAGPGRRYTTTVDVAETESRERHYVVFHAKGAGDLAPLHPGKKPFAVSNPIFFGP